MSDQRSAVVVGAGLAGLAAARALASAGWQVDVLEAGDAPGGRMRSDVVDGFVVDRGFQVLNSAYPELHHLGPLAHGDVRPPARFEVGALLVHGGRRHRILDPRRHPASAPGAITAPVGSSREKAALAAFLLACAYTSPDRIRRRTDVAFAEQLQQWGLDGRIADRFVRPFLAGVLLEREMVTSQRFVDFVWRTFVRGDVYVPAGGMQRFPEALAATLPAGALRLGRRVHAVRPGVVETDDGEVRADAVVVAADPRTAAALLGLPAPQMRAVTTVWHVAAHAPTPDKLLLLDGDGGPVVNSVVMSNVAPAYAPDGRALIASSYLGTEPLEPTTLHRHLGALWGVDTSGWETVAVSSVPEALPAMPGGSPLRRSVRLDRGLYVAGDWRDTPSTQGALVSGRRAARAAVAEF